MHNNSTEKPGKLQDQFENFGDNPSVEVWNKIAIEIKPKKKKRRFIWLFFTFVGLSVLGFFLQTKSITKSVNIKIGQSNNSKSLSVTEEKQSNKKKTNQNSSILNVPVKSTSKIEKGILKVGNYFTENSMIKIDNNSFNNQIIPEILGDEINLNTIIDKVNLDSVGVLPFWKFKMIYNPTKDSNLLKVPELQSGFSFSVLAGMNYQLQKSTPARNYSQYNLSFLAKYQFRNSFALETGIILLKNKYDFNISPQLSFQFNDIILGIPLKASAILFKKNKISSDFFVGSQFQYMAKSNDRQFVGDANSSLNNMDQSSLSYTLYAPANNGIVNKFNNMSQFGFNFYYRLNPNLSLRFSPFYQFYTKKCERFSFVTNNTKHWIGFQVGIQF